VSHRRPQPDVAVLKRRRLAGVSAVEVRRDAQAILRHLGEDDAELTVSLVDDGAIHELNRRYRGNDCPTDVLAFAMREGAHADLHPGVLGDVVISLDTAARQAEEHGLRLGEEVDRLLVHGILHLAGYDHEISLREERRMKRKERAMRALLGGRRPR